MGKPFRLFDVTIEITKESFTSGTTQKRNGPTLKSLLSDVSFAQNVSDKLQGEYLIKCFKKARPIKSFLVFFVKIASNLEMFGLSFNLIPSLPSVATNDRKQNKCDNIVLNNKPGPLFLKFS